MYKNKYHKYKSKYLTLKKLIGGGKEYKTLHLNNSNFIDTMKLNDAHIYVNTSGLYVINFGNKNIAWRGYNNRKCANLLIPPGSDADKFKYEPTWYGPPEVTVIYATMNMEDAFLRTYEDFDIINETLNIDDALRKYDHLLEANYSSIVAYSPMYNYELIDVNNIENLKKLLELFEKNWTIDNFKKLFNLNRITDRQLLRIYSWFQAMKNTYHNQVINTSDNFETMSEQNKRNELHRFINYIFELEGQPGQDLQNYLKNILIYNFRKVFGFGDYQIIENQKIGNRKIKENDYVTVTKDLENPPINNVLLNEKTSENLRNKMTTYLNRQTIKELLSSQNYKDILNMINTMNKKNENILKKISKILEDYEDYKNSENFKNISEKIFKKFIEKNDFAEKKIEEINAETIVGYTSSCGGQCNIGFEKMKINGEICYKVYIHYIIISSSAYGEFSFYKNNSEKNILFQDNTICKLCELAYKRNWLNAKIHGILSHTEGLTKNISYYDYVPFERKVTKTGFCFENTFGKSYLSENEERILSIPYTHLGTMFSNVDCRQPSRSFPPHGLVRENVFAVGAFSLTEDSHYAEVIYYLMSTYNAALTYAYKKTGKKHSVADLNYKKYYGKFYRFKNPIKGGTGKPQVYINFHCKVNSEPHLHLHVYLNSFRSNLYDTLEYGRLKHDSKSRLARTSVELFGNDGYGKYHEEGRNQLIVTGPRLHDESNPAQIEKPTTWYDEHGIVSQKAMHFPCSFEYLAKKLFKLDDDHELMKYKLIFDEPEYDLQPDLWDQTSLSYADEYHQSNVKQYEEMINFIGKIITSYPDVYKEKKKHDKVTTPKIGTISVRYGESINEDSIVRQSTTEGDAIMMLFLQIACIDQPNIGGYFGSSAPLINNMKNITHTEIGLFNTIDYPMNIITNAKFSSCFHTSYSEKIIRLRRISIFIMYALYYKQSQKKYEIKGVKVKRIKLIKQFMESDIYEKKEEIFDDLVIQKYDISKGQMGGKNPGEKVENIQLVEPPIVSRKTEIEPSYRKIGIKQEINPSYGKIGINPKINPSYGKIDINPEINPSYGKIGIKPGIELSYGKTGIKPIEHVAVPKQEMKESYTDAVNIFKEIIDIDNIDVLIKEFNRQTKEYILNENEQKLAKNTLLSLYYNQIPTNQQNEWYY